MSFGPTSTAVKKSGGDLNSDVPLTLPPGDAISALSWSPVANFLAAASWDNTVRVYDVSGHLQGTPRAGINFEGPVLSCDWSRDGRMVVGAGTDNTARLLDLGANGSSAQQVALHAGPIRSVRFLEVPNTREQLIVTGSWDKTVRYWDPRSPSLVGSLLVNEKVHSLDVKDSTLVVATAERKIHIVDLTDPTRISRSPVNPLLHQIRVVSCFPNSQGFAVGGIEGRVGIIWANEAHSRKNYSFKYPREQIQTTTGSLANIYSVNAISFHPVHKNIFSTAGSDGLFHFWDRDGKTRVKLFPEVGGPISATGFSYTGDLFAYAVSYDWSKGFAFNTPDGVNTIMLHRVLDNELGLGKMRKR